MGRRKHGADGEDLIVEVPVGTVVRDADTGELIADMSSEDQEIIIAGGGRGGLGNDHFKSSTNRAPRKTTKGVAGEEREVELELKLLADVGLVGMPNAGKSTLISRISSSHPRIADYPFTTLEPHLGVVDLGDYRTCVVADIPGLIPGAHEGKGLGTQFLRHLDRCSMLLHLVDASTPPTQALADLNAISKELELFSPSLAEKPRVVVLSKLDVTEAQNHQEEICSRAQDWGYDVVAISAVSGVGIRTLLGKIVRIMEDQALEEKQASEVSEDWERN